MNQEIETLIGDRAAVHRAGLFVGRRKELETFETMLDCDDERRFFFVHGLPGIGKTMFIRECIRRAKCRGCITTYLDSNSTPGSQPELLELIQRKLETLNPAPKVGNIAKIRNSATRPNSGGAEQRCLLAIDSFERLSKHESFFFNELFPSISRKVRILVAGRALPNERFLTDPGWSSLSAVSNLQSFTLSETGQYLEKCGISLSNHERVYYLTHGHPLALALAVQILNQNPDAVLQPDDSEKYLTILLKQFTRSIPSFMHRRALWLSAMVPYTTQCLLRKIIDEENSHLLLDWLGELSFARVTRRGVEIHELVKDVLRADLQWRDPELFRFYLEEISMLQLDSLETWDEKQRKQTFSDLAYTASIIGESTGSAHAFTNNRNFSCDEPEEDDWPIIEAMVEKHEGESSLSLLRYWREKGANTIFFQSEQNEECGFLMFLRLEKISTEEASLDPAAFPLRSWLDENNLIGDRPAILCRFWMCRDFYQSVSSCRSFIFLHIVRQVMSMDEPVCIFAVTRDPDKWLNLTRYADLKHFEMFDFNSNGCTYGLLGRVMENDNAVSWLKKTGRMMLNPGIPDRVISTPSRITLHDFEREIKKALKSYHHPEHLKNSLLLNCCFINNLIHPKSNWMQKAEKLVAELFNHGETLKKQPSKQVFFEVLNATYFEPSTKQRVAAEKLCMSFGTYRRRLSQATKLLAERIWMLETADNKG